MHSFIRHARGNSCSPGRISQGTGPSPRADTRKKRTGSSAWRRFGRILFRPQFEGYAHPPCLQTGRPQKEKVKVRQSHIVMKRLVRCADSMDTWCAEMRQCARGVSLAFHMSIGIPPGTGQASGLHMDAAALEAEEAGPGTHSGYRSLNAFCVYQRRRLPMRRPWPPVIRPLRQPPLAGRAEHAIPVRRAARLSPCFIWKIATAQSPCPCF